VISDRSIRVHALIHLPQEGKRDEPSATQAPSWCKSVDVVGAGDRRAACGGGRVVALLVCAIYRRWRWMLMVVLASLMSTRRRWRAGRLG
jgi:hypothetical protein